MRVLVVGAGAYVTGRGTGGPGTVLPALAEASRTLPFDGVTVAATRPDEEGAAEVAEAAGRVNRALGTSLEVDYRRAEPLLGGDGLARFDAAVVAVPDHLHAEVGRRVLGADLHCLMVKPLTPTLAEGRELARLAADRGLHAVVELHKRYDEANLVVRRLLAEGRFGRLAYATVEFSQRITIPTEAFRGWVHRTNVFQYLGVHYVDLIWFLTGFSPVEAMAAGGRGVLAAAGVDALDSVHAIVRWRRPEGGDPFVSQLATGWIDPRTSTAMSDQRYLLVGAAGRIECDQKNRGLALVGAGGGAEAINPYFSQLQAGEDGVRFAGYGHRSIATFLGDVAAIGRGEAAAGDFEGRRATFADALVSTAVVDAVNRSLANGSRWEAVDAAA
jgi:predicted dehydrogenase